MWVSAVLLMLFAASSGSDPTASPTPAVEDATFESVWRLHVAIMRLGPEKRWWEGKAINAYPLWGAAIAP